MLVKDLPKAIIHEHVEGSITPEMAALLANKHGIALPDRFVFAEGTYSQQDYPNGRYAYDESDFGAFIKTYDVVSELLQTPEDYYLIMKDFLSRNAQQGLIYCEMLASPYHMCVREQDGSLQLDAQRYHQVMMSIEKAIEEIRVQYGLETRLHAVGVRHLGEQNVSCVVDFLQQNPRLSVTGFNIAGDERAGQFADFDYAHQSAERLGLGKSYHAGEICPAESIRMAIASGAKRIGHGIKAIDDPQLIQQLIDEDIMLEVSITSNRILVNEFGGQVEKHPVRALYDSGVRISLNTDDAGIFGTDIGKEYQIASDVFGFSRPELLDVTLCAIEGGFVDAPTKQKLIDKVYSHFTAEDCRQLELDIAKAASPALAKRLSARLDAIRP